MTWTRKIRWHLDGSYLAVEEDELGVWFIFDTREECVSLGKFSDLVVARRVAEQMFNQDREKYGVHNG